MAMQLGRGGIPGPGRSVIVLGEAAQIVLAYPDGL